MIVVPDIVVRFTQPIVHQYLVCSINGLEKLLISTSIRVRQQAHFVLVFFDLIFLKQNFLPTKSRTMSQSNSIHFFSESRINTFLRPLFWLSFLVLQRKHLSINYSVFPSAPTRQVLVIVFQLLKF